MNIIDVKNTTQWGRRAPVIGIDLGTTNASAAVYLKDGNMIKPDGNVKIIAIEDNQDDQEKGTTANCVAFTETETLRGSPAKSRVFLNPENSIFEMKRMIGRKFDDPKIQQDMENWPFKVVNVDGVLKIHAEALGETKTFVPEEIIAIFLDKIKRGWCSFFDGNLDEVGVVIAVPACFNDSQRQATMNAAQIAGLRATLINEPTAAALAYGFEENLRGDKNVLIFDLGGGTLDASVINIKDGLRIEVKSTAGDSDLGGVDFDNLLVAHFIKEFKKKHRRDLQTCPKALQRLRYNCEYAKRRLSSYFEVGICIENLFEGKNFESELTRAQFEDMCTDLFRSTLRPVERALSDAEMAKGSIDEVVLIGGSTRIPKIKELLKDFFDGKEPLSISLDGAVAYGAAVYAAREYEVADEKVSSVNVVDITPVSLGIETIGGVMTPTFKRNSQIPCYMTNAFITAVDNQSSIDVNVYEGEQAMAKDNRWVGRFTIQNIPPAPKEVPQIEVKTRLSASGFEVLEIVQPSLVTYLGLPDDEVIRMSDELLRLQEDEKIRRERNKARRDFEEYLFFRKEQLESSSTDSLLNKEFWMRFCDTQLEWMMTHPMEDPRDIEQKHIDVHFEMIGYHDE